MMRLREGPIPKIINGLFFYIGWGALVAGAANNHPWSGSLLVVAALIFHFMVTTTRARDLLYTVIIAVSGWLLDTLFFQFNLISYASPNSWLTAMAPAWLLLLYAQLATAVDQSMVWMRSYPILALLAGPFGGITSYSLAAELGAVTFLQDRFTVLATIGVVWFIFLPFAFWFSRFLDKTETPFRHS